MSNKTLKFIDFCAGIGGGRIGLETNGLTCIAYSEIDRDADSSYKCFYGNKEPNIGDLMTTDISAIPDFDLMISGFPCQTFSSVGKREGFDSERGQIIFGLMKILKEKKIPYFILENVKGFVNHDKGNSINTVLSELDKIGYDVYWKVLNSLDFGVPQSRERVYIVGIRKDVKHTPIQWNTNITSNLTLKNCLDELHGEPISIYNKSWQRYLNTDKNKGKFIEEELLSEDYLIIDRRNSDMRLYREKIPTLRRGNHGLFYVYQKNLYKLNGYQALLLQGFPREFIYKAKAANISPNKLLSQCGNAMTVNVVQAVCKLLLNSLQIKNAENKSCSLHQLIVQVEILYSRVS